MPTRTRLLWVLPALATALCPAGCGDDSATTPPNGNSGGGGSGGSGGGGSAGGSGGGGSGGEAPIVWTPCPLNTDDATGSDAECAEIPVPAAWDDPSAGTITFFVKRRLADNPPSRGQLWLLNGGPGYSGADFEPLAAAIGAVDKTIDIYMPDHRGVGRSSRLSCPDGESDASEAGFSITDAEMPGCIEGLRTEWGDKLATFTVTNAARDLGEIIARTRAPGAQVIVYGGSYGTVWAHRYLQLYPAQPTGIVLDAIAVNSSLSDMDVWFNDLGKIYLDSCGADGFCSGKLGPDPWETMTQTLDDADAGACPAITSLGFDRATLHLLFSSFFYSWGNRPLIPALVHRLGRCSPADVNAFTYLAGLLTAEQPPPTPSQRLFSEMLSMHITLSELWPSPPPAVADLEAFRATANVAHWVPTVFARYHDAWPRYVRDAYAGPLADFTGSVLMLHGELDFIPMSINDPIKAQYDGPNQTFALVPRAPHGSFQSPTPPNGASCGGYVFKQFVDDPTAAIDASCADAVEPLVFDDSTLGSVYLGTTDLWDGDPGPTTRTPRAPLRAAWVARVVQRAVREGRSVAGDRHLRPAMERP